MRRLVLAALLASSAAAATAQTPKDQLLSPPADARHYTITSSAGKHGDMWSWAMPDGRAAYRMSMSLRGWVTEDDEVITRGADGRPTAIAIRGFTDQGDATEELDAQYGSDDLDIGYNAAYLLDILRTIDSEDVDIRLNTPVTAGLIAPTAQTDKGGASKEDLLCLVMPLRLAS